MAIPLTTTAERQLTLLGQLAENEKLYGNIPLRRYYDCLLRLFRMAEEYYIEHNFYKAYFFNKRYVWLVDNELSKHPHYEHLPEECITEIGWRRKLAEKSIDMQKHEVLLQFMSDTLENRVSMVHKELEKFSNHSSQPPRTIEMSSDEAEGSDSGSDNSFLTNSRRLTPPEALPQLNSDSPCKIPRSRNNKKKTVKLAVGLTEEFLKVASDACRTYAVLCGRETDDVIEITDCLIPNDFLEKVGMQRVIDAFAQRKILPFGWIRCQTETSQNVLSIDLHSQFTYQNFSPEAIGIICNLHTAKTTALVLTESGLEMFRQSNGRPMADKWYQENMITSADHVELSDELSFNITDLRN